MICGRNVNKTATPTDGRKLILSHIGKEWFRKRSTRIHSALQISLRVQGNADIYQN